MTYDACVKNITRTLRGNEFEHVDFTCLFARERVDPSKMGGIGNNMGNNAKNAY